MARLPVPGSDDGQWGTVLNEYLSTVHNSDGSLKDGVISEQKLDSALQTKVNSGSSGVTSVNTRTGAVTLTASDVGLANVNNTSDANKPISTAAQAALDAKADTSHTHTSYLTNDGENIITLADSAAQFIRVNIPDDGSATSGWPDRYVNYFDGTRTGYFNEYGEVRARPAKTSTVSLRAMGHSSGSTGDIFQVTNSGQTQTYFNVSASAAALSVPLTSTQNIAAPNIGAKLLVLDAGDPVPGGTPAGTIIFRRS